MKEKLRSSVMLGGLANGAIVWLRGRWGVVCPSPPGPLVVVDFWGGGREYVHHKESVDVLETTHPDEVAVPRRRL